MITPCPWWQTSMPTPNKPGIWVVSDSCWWATKSQYHTCLYIRQWVMDYLPKPCVYVCKFIIHQKQLEMWHRGTLVCWDKGRANAPQLKSVDITRLLQSYSERHLKDNLFLLWPQVCLFTMAVVLGLLKSGVNIWRVEGQKSWPWKDQRDEKRA